MDDRILKLLESPIESDRRRAIDMIAESNDNMLLKPLANAIKREPDPQLRDYGMKVLANESGEIVEELFGEMFTQFKQGNFNLGKVFENVAHSHGTTLQVGSGSMQMTQGDLLSDEKPKRGDDPFENKLKRDDDPFAMKLKRDGSNTQKPASFIAELLNSLTTILLAGAIIAYLLFTTVATEIQDKIPSLLRSGDYSEGAMVGIYSFIMNLQTENPSHIVGVVVGSAVLSLIITLVYSVLIHYVTKSMGGDAPFWRGFNRVGQGFFAFLMVIVLLGAVALNESLLNPVATYIVDSSANGATLSTKLMAPGNSFPSIEAYALLGLLVGTVLVGLLAGWVYRMGFIRGILSQAVVTVILGGGLLILLLPATVRLVTSP